MLISVFEFEDYRVFLNTWIDAQTTRGIKGRLAEALGVSSTLVSLILKGDKHLSAEQAMEAVDYLGLQEKEADYFLLLVELGRAGSVKLQNRLKSKINLQKKESQQLNKRLRKDLELDETQKAIYYSSWIYTGIRNLSALEQYHDVTSIAQRLSLPPGTVNKALEFLIDNGLCQIKDGHITYGPAYTHVSNESPFVNKHHQNWRVRGFQNMDARDEKNLFYTCPMSLSKETAEQVRTLMLNAIQEILKMVGPSPSEEVFCLNMDWFKY